MSAIFCENWPSQSQNFTRLTGVLVKQFSKKQIENLLEKNGYEWAPLTKKLDLLVIGDDPGQTKLKKANKYGIKIISWPEFTKEYLNK